jgi:hypothetical protein
MGVASASQSIAQQRDCPFVCALRKEVERGGSSMRKSAPRHRLSWIAAVLLLSSTLSAQMYPPLARSDFQIAVGTGGQLPQGFGDRQNSWAWSSAWFKDKLVVGTARSYDCMVQAALNRNLFIFPYPPLDPDQLCTPNYRDLPLQAEIWTWTPATNTWQRVYQSPRDVPVPDAAGKFTARDVGYRYMFVYKESDGTEALYISGLSSRFIYGTAAPPGRLLRTTDLINFTAVPANPGTVLGDLANAGFRGITQYKGKMYIIGGSIEGNGVVLESATPSAGNNSFRVITRPGELASEIDVFNNFLYLSLSDIRGFRVVKTDATPGPGGGYTFQEVIPHGGGRTFFPNRDVWSMRVFKDRLYIGGNGVASWFGAELYRISPDDTWEVVSGDPRTVNGVLKAPISGLGPGFGWFLNAHIWRQGVFDDRLYIGTFDMSSIFKDVPLLNLLLAGEMGADLWRTDDGVYFTPVDNKGFGDKFNFGFRLMQPTPYGLFTGTANYWYGLQLFRGVPRGFVPPIAAPLRLDVESAAGKVLLSWERDSASTRFRIFRQESQLVDSHEMRAKGAQGPVPVLSDAQQIGETLSSNFADLTAVPNRQYLYFVRAIDRAGNLSDKSNPVSVPSVLPPVTLARVSAYIGNCHQSGCFLSTYTRNYVTAQYARSIEAASKGDLRPLTALYALIRRNVQYGKPMMEAYAAEDLATMLGRLTKRFGLVLEGHLSAASL